VIRGAAALSAAIAGSFESSSRSGFFSSRPRSTSGRLGGVGPEVRLELLDVAGGDSSRHRYEFSRRTTSRSPASLKKREASRSARRRRQARVADRLDVELPELAVSPACGPVISGTSARVRVSFTGLRQRLHSVLDVGADDSGGRLGASAQLSLVGVRGQADSSFSMTSVTSPTPRSKTASARRGGVSIGR
jgi:hypothetical protein